MTVKHKFVNPQADDPTVPNEVRPSNWNDDHDVVLDPTDLPTITLTGDVGGSGADGDIPTTLATVNPDVGSFTNANITVDAKGRITAAADGSGGSTSPGGANGQVQYNDSGSFGGFTVSGDAALDTSTGDLTLDTVNTDVGSFTNANITVNAKGLITAAADGSSGGTGTVTSVELESPNSTIAITGTNPITTSGTADIDIADTAVTPGNYTNTNLTVDQQGRITAASNGSAGTGTVTTTGSPASGNLTKFSGATSITNADLSGDVTTSGALATTIKTNVALAGSPTTTTQSAGDNSTKISTTAFVTTAVANAISGVNPAIAVSAATTGAGNTSTWTYNNGASGVGATFTGPVNTAIVIDGFTYNSTSQSLLVKNDTQSPSGAFNGIFNLTALQTTLTGAIFTRRLDYDTPSDINNTGAIPVVNGTVNGSTTWVLTSAVATVGTDPLTYTQFSLNPTTIITTSTSAGGDLTGTYPNPTFAPAVSTWTPSLLFGGAASGLTYTAQLGYYTKIGKLINCSLMITINSKGTSTGNATISGLPIAVKTLSGGASMSMPVGFSGGGASAFSLVLDSAATIMRVFTIGGAALTNASFANGQSIWVNFFYFTD